MARVHRQSLPELHNRLSLLLSVVMSWQIISVSAWLRQRPPLPDSSIFELLHRRAMLKAAPLLAATVWASATQPAQSSTGSCGYPVCKTQDEWRQALSEQQFFILRREGTESPRSSPLLQEKRRGQFQCAACGAQLFSSIDKFTTQAGWLSFADASNVEVEKTWLESVTGAKVKCARCGSHIGERFLDGSQYLGTRAARTGRRYCINGAGLYFIPEDGSVACSGEAPAADAIDYWKQVPWRMADGGLRPI